MSRAPKPTTDKQAALLKFFGKAAPAYSLDAHKEITRIRELPPVEQARMVLGQLEPLFRDPMHPQNSHNVLFRAACILVQGFALEIHEAQPLLAEYATRSDQAWSESELFHKVTSASRATSDKPRGYLLDDKRGAASWTERKARGQTTGDKKPEPEKPKREYTPRKLAMAFDPVLLRQKAGKWRDIVNVEWLANRSVADVSQIGPKEYLKMMYPAGELVLVFDVFRSQGQALWPKEDIPMAGENGVWYLAQPVNGQKLPNPRVIDEETKEAKLSRRSQESVTAFRYLVLECDKAKEMPKEMRMPYMKDWLGLLVQLPLRIEAIYTSGGDSIHALVRVDQPTHRAWEDYVQGLMPMLNLLGAAGVDPQAVTSIRLTRLPGCLRAGKLQKLLYLRPGAPVAPITERSPERDVVKPWVEKANHVIDGLAESTPELRRALDYYAPANATCRALLQELGEG